jgi:hypothetical protein
VSKLVRLQALGYKLEMEDKSSQFSILQSWNGNLCKSPNRNNNICKLLFIWMLFSTALDANNPDTDGWSKEHGVA